MNSPFFDIIQWDAIYERRQDGPYIPELPSFMKKRREYDQSPLQSVSIASTGEGSSPSSSFSATGSMNGGNSVSVNGDWKKIDFSPLPLDRMTIPDPKEEEQKKQAKANATAATTTTTAKKENERGSDSNHDEEGGDDDDEDESDSEDESEEEEEMAIRDSVFVGSQAMANNQNQLPDWSFIDEAVLMSYITNAAQEGKEKQKKTKGKKSKKGTASSNSTTSGNGDSNDNVNGNGETVNNNDEKKMETIEEGKEEEEEVAASSPVQDSTVPQPSSTTEEKNVHVATATPEVVTASDEGQH